MIDWWGLFRNALWVVGLAVVLAAFSVSSYHAYSTGVRLRQKLDEPAFQVPFSAGMLLCCLGLLLGGRSWLERLLWGVLAAVLVAQLVWSWRGQAARGTAGRSDQVGAHSSKQGSSRRGRTRWLGWGLVFAGFLFLIGWGLFTAVQLLDRARSLHDHLQHLEALAQGDVTKLGSAELQEAGQHLEGMRQDLEAVQAQVGPLPLVGRALGWVPRYGGDLAAAADLLQIAGGVTSAGDRTFQALAPALDLLSGVGNNPGLALRAGERLLPVLSAAQPELQVARQELLAVKQARARIDASSLSSRVAGLLTRLDQYLPWFQTAVDGALLAPELLGADGPRTYLLVAQNNQELRPTGGFISGVGELTVEGGRIGSLSFSDSYGVDNHEVPHELTPPAFQQTLYGQLWFFRDANWDADLPTSARRILDIYARDRGVQADGVITLDLVALQYLVDAVGPLSVEGIAEPVGGNAVLQVIQDQWGESSAAEWRDWWLHRKDFMGQIARAAMDRLAVGEGVEPAKLGRALARALDEKHILVYLEDRRAAELLRERNWDGSLPASSYESDLLVVVDTNVGFNKVDPNVARSIHYQVDLSSQDGPRAQLTLRYHNLSSRPVEACVQESRYGDTYADMMDRCYWNYVRVYVPAGSRLLEGPSPLLPPGSLLARNRDELSQQPLRGAFTEGDWSVWSAFFDLAPGAERTLTFDYELPDRVLSMDTDHLVHYRLRVQKQPGTEAVPLQVEVLLPPGAQVVAAMPTELPIVATDLRVDREFEIVYRERKDAP